MAKIRPGWAPELLRQHRESHGLTLEACGEALRRIAVKHKLTAPAANFQTIWAHEHGDVYPGPHYRRAYCLLYSATEPELGFRSALPVEAAEMPTPKTESSSSANGTRLLAVLEPGRHSEGMLLQLKQRLQERRPRVPVLVLVAGYAGSGKTELSKVLARDTGWLVLDKDTLTRPLVEDLLVSLGSSADDRHSPTYLQQVRPREYECLMDTAFENLAHGRDVIASAPFIGELSSAEWVRQTSRCCDRLGSLFLPIWVRCDQETMRENIEFRAAARDAWKLDHWLSYAQGLRDGFAPVGGHLVIDNRYGKAVQVCDRAEDARP